MCWPALLPDEEEVLGLLALMLLIHARRAARVDADGLLVRLGDQDRRAWDRALIAEGQGIVRHCLRRNRPGPYQIQAAINAVHADAPTAGATDWRQIVALYDQLLAVAPTPIVALNRAVAVAEVDGPAAALRIVESLAAPSGTLDGYPLLHAIRADLLERLGRRTDAVAALDAAISGSGNAAERAASLAAGRRSRLESTAGIGSSRSAVRHGRTRARRTSVATEATSSPGSTGLARCISKPLCSARVRSSARAKAVSAAAGTSRTDGSADARRRRMKS